ncbi:ABC transporter substrate-binding protein, partial [Pseudomonas aeruginosa]|uniref:ABC transporter substrate-binding protein n=1 Tax=Pseudomonas aeruginosa TaxID=287 RepID=UPI0031B6F052
AFETGDIDLLYGNEGLLPLDTFARFSQNPAYHTQLSQPIETVMLALNTAKAPTNELAVREALNYAVNEKSLIDNALYGNEGLLPLDTFARFSQNPAYHTQLSQPIE